MVLSGYATFALPACLVVALLMLPVAFVGLFFGWELMLPVSGVLLVARALAAKGRLIGDICPVCGGGLVPSVIEPCPPQGRLRAVYLCTVHGHRSWRWADAGALLRPELEELLLITPGRGRCR